MWAWPPYVPTAAGGGGGFVVAWAESDVERALPMRKNVAGQSVSAVLVSATDGSAVTASVSVTVTIDRGVQAAGAGTVTHEGGGEWSYAPTQAETNGDHILFKFSGGGSIPKGVERVTISYDPHDTADLGLSSLTGHVPQTGDSFARLGAPAGASIAADIAVIEAQTDDIGVAGAGLTALGDARLANLDATVSSRSTLSAAQVNAEVDAALDTAIPALPTADSINERLKTLDDNYTAARAAKLDNADVATSTRATPAQILATPANLLATDATGRVTVGALGPDTLDAAALKADAVTEIVNAMLASIIEGAITLKQSLQLSNAAAAGKLSGAATTTATIRNLADTIDRIVAVVDADGNRTAVVRTFE